MEGLGVIERVKELKNCCAGMVVAPKASGEVRICVNLTLRNDSVNRGFIFSGFWQINLDEQSREITKLITVLESVSSRKCPLGSMQHRRSFSGG